jgi:hypothetical protein
VSDEPSVLSQLFSSSETFRQTFFCGNVVVFPLFVKKLTFALECPGLLNVFILSLLDIRLMQSAAGIVVWRVWKEEMGARGHLPEQAPAAETMRGS